MKTSNYLLLAFLTSFLFVACTSESSNKQDTEEKEEMAEESQVKEPEMKPENDVVVVHEHHFDEVAVTSHGTKTIAHEKKKSAAKKPAEDKESAMAMKEEVEELPEPETAEVHPVSTLDNHLVASGYEKESEVEVTEAIIPIDETESIIAYNKKGDQTGVLQVVSGPDGEVKQIFFADKKHRDKYDVANGMTAKEAKKLRKRLKHVEHKSNHYLYDDQSNIMYLLDAVDEDGNEISVADVDKMEVRAIVWTDKDGNFAEILDDSAE